jgi:asparagine synthase (glutamine-hydrolysing)
MCGIAGAIAPGRGRNFDLTRPLNAQIHRGPDGAGVWTDQNCALGQRRLAIIDLSEAAQGPLENEDGTVAVTFNGEIYNFQELRKQLEAHGHRFKSRTDTEVIVHAYEQWGAACVERFRGMFAFAIWDARARRMFLARDRVGKKPLFYTQVGNQFFFASELQGLLAFEGVRRTPDLAALNAYLAWGYVPAPSSAFEGIYKLPPAHTLTVDLTDGGLKEKVECYWSLDYEPKVDWSEAEAGERLRAALTEAVRLRLISDVPVGAFLSGGIDSSIVVGLMAQLSSVPVQTFSIGFEEQGFDELPHARRIAQLWGTDHHEHIVKPDAAEVIPILARHYGEPFADSSAVPTYYVAKMTAQNVKVALNGDGGDESFAGYERYWGQRMAARFGRAPGLGVAASLLRKMKTGSERSNLRRAVRFLEAARQQPSGRYASWMSYLDVPARASLCTPEFLSYGDSAGAERIPRLFKGKEDLDPVDAAMSVDVRSYLPYDLLVKVDIAAMASSLEGRSPLLDHEVMELAARLPAKMKLRGRRGKHILTETFKDLLPSENVERRKMGFGVPVGAWFRGPLKDLLMDSLLSERALTHDYFQRDAVVAYFGDHMEGRADHGQRLWSLLMLEMWHQEVVNAPAPAS